MRFGVVGDQWVFWAGIGRIMSQPRVIELDEGSSTKTLD
jgi:hypothetical protein